MSDGNGVNGERNFSTEGIKATKFDSTPVPSGDYDLKLLDNIEIRKKAEPGALPYVAVRFEMLSTAKNGGKNRLLFHNMFVGLEPGRDGVMNPARASQIAGYAQSLGETFKTTRIIDVTNKTGGKTSCIDPRALVDWLKTKIGSISRAHVKTRPAKDGYEAKNEVGYFHSAEGEGATMPEGFGGTKESTKWVPEGEA